MLRLQSAFQRMKETILRQAEPLHLRRDGKVTGVTTNSAGIVVSAEVTVDGVVYQNVAPTQQAGLGVGAMVEVEAIGGAGSVLSWKIERVKEGAAGAVTTQPHYDLSTPDIYEVAGVTRANPDGTMVTTLDVIVEAIAEQYRLRQRIFYEIEIRDADTGATLGLAQSIVLERVEATLHATVDDNDTSATINRLTGGAEFRFPFANGIVEWGSELSKYAGVLTVSATQITLQSLERGYNGTVAAGHTEGDRITLRGVPITKEVATVAEYEIRVRAIDAANHASNWSDAVNYEHAGDTTAPAWSGAVGLTATPIREGMRLGWNPADTNASDLAYYELRASPDNASWTTQRAGNGTGWVWQVTARGALYFQVRAVDTSGNASSWSASTRGAVRLWDDEVEKTADLITNGAFPSNTTDWTAVTAGTLSHDAAHGLAGLGCAKIEEDGGAVPSNTNFYQDSIAITAGNYYVVEMHVSTDGDIKAVDEFKLQLNLFGGSAIYESSLVLGTQMPSIDDNKWIVFRAEGVAPFGATLATVNFSAELNRGVGETSYLYIDDVRMWEMVQSKGLASLARADFTELFLGGVNLDTRLDGVEGDVSALETEIVDAREGEASLDAKIDAMEAVTATKLAIASNLSDLNNAATARTNLGLGTAATKNVGTGINDVAAGTYAQEIVDARGGEASLDARLDKRDAVYMRYTSNAGQNITSATNTIINYEDMGFESADYVTTGASWKFQPTLAGTYRVTASFQMASSNWSSGDVFQIGLFKNGSAVAFNRVYVPALTSQIPQVQISDLVQLDGSSDYIDLRGGGAWSAGGNKALSTDNRTTYICIERI